MNDMNDDISTAISPGKFILLGEHAVVYGKPAVALAIDMSFSCSVSAGEYNSLNGVPIDLSRHPHIQCILSRLNVNNINITTWSDIPSGSGLGSSAALSSSLDAAIRNLTKKDMDLVEIARDSFEAEYYAQGRASPLDTSTCTFGKGVAINVKETDTHLWDAEKEDGRWSISKTKVPEMTFVIGYTGIKASTGLLVEKVRKYKEHNRFASDVIDEIEMVTMQGIDDMRNDDVVSLGKNMTANHKLLSILGVSCNELNKLVNAAERHSYGAKLTGSGGGGCMIALTDRPEIVCEDIRLHGGIPYTVKTGVDGVTIV